MMYDPKRNSLLEISIVSIILGIITTTSLFSLIYIPEKYIPIIIYIIILCLYFIIEFINSSLYQPLSVNSKSFLIYGNKGNKHFWYMQLLTIWEYFIIRSNKLQWIYTPIRYKVVLQPIGMIMIISGIYIRHLAMKTCGNSFTHYISTIPRHQQHKLVTHGIYSIFRHPSYFGFWCFVIGSQLFLCNIGNLVIDLWILGIFFLKRIEYEEWLLIHKFYGQEYREYKDRVHTWIPFVRINE